LLEITNHDKKTVCFWMSQAEKNDSSAQAIVKNRCSIFREQKYSVCIFYSGEEDLYPNILGLLQHNRRLCVDGSLIND